MTAVRILLRAGLRRRWRAWFGVALLAGVVMGTAAGARRTDSVYPRLLACSKSPDMAIWSRQPRSASRSCL